MEAGLVEGEGLYLDATKVDANASVHTLRTRFSVVATREHVERVLSENPVPEEPVQPLTEAATVHSQPVSPEAPKPVAATGAEPRRRHRPPDAAVRSGL